MSWKLSDWNAIIRRFNALISAGCVGGVPLEEVTPPHKWSISDLQIMRDKLTEMCSGTPAFTTPLDIWRQSTVDELNAAIDNCQCTCDPNSEAGTYYNITCNYIDIDASPTDYYRIIYAGNYQLGDHGKRGRLVSIMFNDIYHDGTPTTATLECNGRLQSRSQIASSYVTNFRLSDYPTTRDDVWGAINNLLASGLCVLDVPRIQYRDPVYYVDAKLGTTEEPGVPTCTMTIASIPTTSDYFNWLRCVSECQPPDYHVSNDGTLRGECWLSEGLHRYVGSTHVLNRWWETLEALELSIANYNEQYPDAPLAIDTIRPWSDYMLTGWLVAELADGAQFVSLKRI
jgi:hypothetical protein